MLFWEKKRKFKCSRKESDRNVRTEISKIILEREKLLGMYKIMLKIRRFEEKVGRA